MTDAQAWAEDAERKLLDEALRLAPAEGWTRLMVKRAGRVLGLTPGEVELILPNGPADLAALLSRRHDERALALLAEVDPQGLKIRERIRRACEARIDAATADEAAFRRWLGWLSLPQNLALGARLAWASADVLWRWAGDTATDENHYSKRAILAGVLTGAYAIRISSGRQAALAFVDRRIDNVMAYEKWKATGGFRPSVWMAAAAHALGRARYGARQSPE